MTIKVEAPRVNANEDQLHIVQVLVREGQEVAAGELLFVAETSKASHEIEAPTSGWVDRLSVRSGQMVEVGASLCVVRTEAEHPAEGGQDQAVAGTVKITLKARQRAAELGIAIETVEPVDGRIGVEQVEAQAQIRAAGIASDASPAAARTEPGGSRALVYGAGGHAAVVLDLVLRAGYQVVGCVADGGSAGAEVVAGIRLIGDATLLPHLRADGVGTAFIGVGGIESNAPRRRIYERLQDLGFHLPPVIAGSAHVGLGAQIGPGSLVCPGAMLGPMVTVGANCIINANAVISHHSTIGDHCHVTPGALLAGECRIGSGCTIGMGATLLNRSVVGTDCLIHNQARIFGRIPDRTEVTATGERLGRNAQA